MGSFSLMQPISIHYNRKTPKTETSNFENRKNKIGSKNEFFTDLQPIITYFVGTFRLLKIKFSTEKTGIGCIRVSTAKRPFTCNQNCFVILTGQTDPFPTVPMHCLICCVDFLPPKVPYDKSHATCFSTLLDFSGGRGHTMYEMYDSNVIRICASVIKLDVI